jgi:hypothetical protein
MKVVSPEDYDRILTLLDLAASYSKQSKNPKLTLAQKVALKRLSKIAEDEMYRLAQ